MEICDEENDLNFKWDQCVYSNGTEKGWYHHVRIKHRISQVAGNIDSEEEILKIDGNTYVNQEQVEEEQIPGDSEKKVSLKVREHI